MSVYKKNKTFFDWPSILFNYSRKRGLYFLNFKLDKNFIHLIDVYSHLFYNGIFLRDIFKSLQREMHFFLSGKFIFRNYLVYLYYSKSKFCMRVWLCNRIERYEQLWTSLHLVTMHWSSFSILSSFCFVFFCSQIGMTIIKVMILNCIAIPLTQTSKYSFLFHKNDFIR